MKAAYVTFDNLDPHSGAGQVCLHEIAALKKAVEEATSLGHEHKVTVISRPDIKGADKYEFNPFLYDYFAAQLIPHGLDLLHLSCSPGLAILDAAHNGHGRSYVTNIVAHDLAISIEEHERYYGKGTYPFKHNTDPYLHELLLKHAEGANMIFTPSTAAERWIRANIKNEHVKVIPHGTDIPAEVIQPVQLVRGGVRFGYLGAFGPDKGLPYLLMAWKHSPNGELVFGGGHCQYIKQLAVQIDPTLKNQAYLGWVDKVSDFYHNIAVYIQPSVTEGFGIETIEAMACARPVIVCSGAGSADAVTDGVDGFVVPPRDPAAILEKMNFFADHPEKITEMGAKAREKVTAQYTWTKVEEMYVNAYRELLR